MTYPATYRAPLRWVVVRLLLLALIFIAIFVGRGHLRLSSPAWQWVSDGLIGGGLFVPFCTDIFCRVTLYEDRIEKSTWFGKKVVSVDRITGLRRGAGNFFVVFRGASGFLLSIPAGMGGDATWERWMSRLPDRKRMGR